jgi:hypothetical protein
MQYLLYTPAFFSVTHHMRSGVEFSTYGIMLMTKKFQILKHFEFLDEACSTCIRSSNLSKFNVVLHIAFIKYYITVLLYQIEIGYLSIYVFFNF